MAKAKNVTKLLEENLEDKQGQFKIIKSTVSVSFVKDMNKTLTVGLEALVNDSSVEDVNDYLFNECLIEASRLLKKVGAQ